METVLQCHLAAFRGRRQYSNSIAIVRSDLFTLFYRSYPLIGHYFGYALTIVKCMALGDFLVKRGLLLGTY